MPAWAAVNFRRGFQLTTSRLLWRWISRFLIPSTGAQSSAQGESYREAAALPEVKQHTTIEGPLHQPHVHPRLLLS